jgi:spore germination protein
MVMEFFKLKGRYRRWIAFALAPVIYFLSLIPQNMEEVSRYAGQIGIYAFLSDGLLILLLFIAILRRKKGEVLHESTSPR